MILLKGLAFVLLFMAGWYVGNANFAAFWLCLAAGFFCLGVSMMDEGKRK